MKSLNPKKVTLRYTGLGLLLMLALAVTGCSPSENESHLLQVECHPNNTKAVEIAQELYQDPSIIGLEFKWPDNRNWKNHYCDLYWVTNPDGEVIGVDYKLSAGEGLRDAMNHPVRNPNYVAPTPTQSPTKTPTQNPTPTELSTIILESWPVPAGASLSGIYFGNEYIDNCVPDQLQKVSTYDEFTEFVMTRNGLKNADDINAGQGITIRVPFNQDSANCFDYEIP